MHKEHLLEINTSLVTTPTTPKIFPSHAYCGFFPHRMHYIFQYNIWVPDVCFLAFTAGGKTHLTLTRSEAFHMHSMNSSVLQEDKKTQKIHELKDNHCPLFLYLGKKLLKQNSKKIFKIN